MKWLREHAANYKLSDEEGKPNETGIEECAKVANWQDKGGAPKPLAFNTATEQKTKKVALRRDQV